MTALTPFKVFQNTGAPPSDTPSDLLNLTSLIKALWFRKFSLSFAALLGGLLALLWATHISTPIYYATSVLVMEPIPERSLDIEAVMPGLGGENSAINTEIEVLSSRAVLGLVVDQLALVDDPEFNPNLISGRAAPILAWATHVGLWPHPPVPTADLQLALDRTATIDQLSGRIAVRNVPDSMVFEITVESPDRLKAAEIANRLADVHIARQIEDKFSANDAALDWLTQRVDDLGKDLQAAETAASEFTAQMQIINPDTMEALSLQLAELRQRIAALDAAALRSNRSNTDSPQRQALLADEVAVSDKILQQSQSIVRLAQLRREADASRLIYESFLARLKETAVQKGVEQADSSILSRAEVAESPAEPKPLIFAVLGAAAALVICSIRVMQQETSRDTFRTSDELVQKFHIPVSGKIRSGPIRIRARALETVKSNPNALFLEDVRNLRTALLAQHSDGNRTILVTSAMPGEGKSTQTVLLAHALGELGRRVLVVDADLRRPSISRFFTLGSKTDQSSLVDVLRGRQDLKSALMKPKDANHYILLAGKADTNPASILSSKPMANLLQTTRKHFDIVLLDAPPLLAAPDARILAGLVDDTLLTVQWDKTRAPQVQQSLDALHSVGANVSNMVLTQVNANAMRAMGAREYTLKPY